MVINRTFCMAGIILVMTACNEPAVVPTRYSDQLNPNERLLVGDWVYSYIMVKGVKMNYANSILEPGTQNAKNLLGGERSILSRRWINYSNLKTYQLRWNRSQYQLGSEGDDNWQPNFGTWQLNESGDVLIHNAGFTYATEYSIVISGDQLTRESERYMSNDSVEGIWKAGETVVFKEVFVRKQ